MIEPLKEGEFRESVISAKVNELVEAFNNHYHKTQDSYGTFFRSTYPIVEVENDGPASTTD